MNRKMTVYYKCNMKPIEHFMAYIICSILATVIIYLFYHIIFVSVIIGFAVGIALEKMYADFTIVKRQKNLRLQFRDFLESMNVAVRAGNVEYKAVKSALDDLKISYNDDADIVIEVQNILLQYENGGKQMKVLFQDLADRSRIEDIKNFAAIYAVIEGKSDRFGDILTQVEEIIGDKLEIEQEIETVITSAKSETYMMLIMPIVIVVAMSAMGGDLLEALFTTATGHIAATVALIIFAISFIIATKSTQINV